MTSTTSAILILILIIACLACAAYRLVGVCLPTKSPLLRAGRRGPNYVLAALDLCAALFLAIPMTIVWGLVLAAMLAICHIVALRKTYFSRASH
jgi:hypothetical protein